MITSTMMLPGIVTQIPTYILFNKLDFINTFYPWLLWGIGGAPFFIFLYRQFFSSIPRELEEAARIDGCSTLRMYWTIFHAFGNAGNLDDGDYVYSSGPGETSLRLSCF